MDKADAMSDRIAFNTGGFVKFCMAMTLRLNQQAVGKNCEVAGHSFQDAIVQPLYVVVAASLNPVILVR
jgi:hypothetical protein